MFADLTVLGGLHVMAAVLALGTAVVVLVGKKGTTAHVGLGRVYAVLLVLVDLSALLTYRQVSGSGPFHFLAVVSLTTLAAAVLWSPRRRGTPETHAILMIWSVAGLMGAGLAQQATAAFPDAGPWPTLAAIAGICVLAALATRAIASFGLRGVGSDSPGSPTV